MYSECTAQLSNQWVGPVFIKWPAPERARECWFPQRLAENNKMLNILPPRIMVAAFSAVLASLEGKNKLQPLNAPPRVRQWPLNCPADFPALFKIYCWNRSPCDSGIQTKRYLKSLAGTICIGRSEWSSACRGYVWSFHCLFFSMFQKCSWRLFVSFEQRDSRGLREHVCESQKQTHSSDNLKAVWHSLHGQW